MKKVLFTAAVMVVSAGAAFAVPVELPPAAPEQNVAVYNAIFAEDVSAVPLPAAGWLLLAGVGGLVALRRRAKA